MPIYLLIPIIAIAIAAVLMLLLLFLGRFRGGKYMQSLVMTLAKIGFMRRFFAWSQKRLVEKQNPELASVMRKIEFFNLSAVDFGLPVTMPALDGRAVAGLSSRIEQLQGVMATPGGQRLRRRPFGQALRRFVAGSSILPRLLAADRYLQDRLQAASNPNWLASYRRMRRRIRERLL